MTYIDASNYGIEGGQVCSDCGALVADTDKHTAWHEAQAEDDE